jgi:6-phospho-beta-glucosidase
VRKISVIGGGSSYTPELLEGLLQKNTVMNLGEITLMDINQERLDVLGALGRRMAQKLGVDVAIKTTQSLTEAVRDSSFVITQFRAGGMAARIRDEKLGLRHGLIGQETTGIGGFAKALRTIPIILDTAHEIERSATGAWLINFANPAGLITEAVLKYSNTRVIGLCNIPIGYTMMVSRALGVPPESVELDYVGLNHFSWVRGCRTGGEDHFADFLELVAKEFEEEGKPSGKAMAKWTRFHGIAPNYYLQYYFCTELMLEELRAKPKTRGEEVVEVEKTLFEKYADPALDQKPEELEKRGGAFYSTAAVNLMESLVTDRQDIQVVNVCNGRTVPDLPPHVAVEAPCRISAGGPAPLPQAPLPPEIVGWLQLVKNYESLTVKAGATGDRRAALMALANHPLIRRVNEVEDLFGEILEENKVFLPQFA